MKKKRRRRSKSVIASNSGEQGLVRECNTQNITSMSLGGAVEM